MRLVSTLNLTYLHGSPACMPAVSLFMLVSRLKAPKASVGHLVPHCPELEEQVDTVSPEQCAIARLSSSSSIHCKMARLHSSNANNPSISTTGRKRVLWFGALGAHWKICLLPRHHRAGTMVNGDFKTASPIFGLPPCHCRCLLSGRKEGHRRRGR